MRMAMMSGPPAIPSLRGTGIPGMAIGSEPKMIPTRMPMKMVAMLGASRRLIELPSTSATRLTRSSGPTTITRSPTCSGRWGLAKRSMP